MSEADDPQAGRLALLIAQGPKDDQRLLHPLPGGVVVSPVGEDVAQPVQALRHTALVRHRPVQG